MTEGSSWQLAVTRRVLKVTTSLVDEGWPLGLLRAGINLTGMILSLGAKMRPTRINAGGISAEWVGDPSEGVIYFVHGGGYTLCSPDSHRLMINRLVRWSGMRLLAIRYRLAPEHPYPAGIEDTMQGYRWLLEQGHDPTKIVFAGDSAGGGLVLAALIRLRDGGEPLPAGAVLMSPWVDIAMRGETLKTKAGLDPIIDARWLRVMGDYYAQGQDKASPEVSPLYADLRGLPPMFVQSGTDEVLLSDSLRLVERAEAAGVDVTLDVWEGLIHTFEAYPFLPEADRAVEKIGEVIKEWV